MGDTIFWILFWIAIVGLVLWYMSRGDNTKSKQTKNSSRIQPSYRKKPYDNKELYRVHNLKYIKRRPGLLVPMRYFKKNMFHIQELIHL